MAEVPLSIIKGFILNVLNELLKVSYSTRDVYKEKTRLSQPQLRVLTYLLMLTVFLHKVQFITDLRSVKTEPAAVNKDPKNTLTIGKSRVSLFLYLYS